MACCGVGLAAGIEGLGLGGGEQGQQSLHERPQPRSLTRMAMGCTQRTSLRHVDKPSASYVIISTCVGLKRRRAAARAWFCFDCLLHRLEASKAGSKDCAMGESWHAQQASAQRRC